MAFRGSLRSCAYGGLTAVHQGQGDEFSVLRSVTGKYYIMLLPADYKRYHDKVAAGELKLVLNCTETEARNLLSKPQIEFNLDPPVDGNGDKA